MKKTEGYEPWQEYGKEGARSINEEHCKPEDTA